MSKLVVAEIASLAGRELSVERGALGDDVDIDRFAFTGDESELIQACQDADCILTDYVPFGRQVLESLNNCQLISVAATGHASVDLETAARVGIRVCAIEEYCTDEVADHTLMLILALARKLMTYHDQVQTANQWQFDSVSGLTRLCGQILGLIGFGRIGQAVARRAQSFGLNVLAYDPFSDAEIARNMNVTLCSLENLLEQSDVISLHCAVTEENLGLINAQRFAYMKRKPILVNVARGELIIQSDLIEALDTAVISAAGIDVLADETPNPNKTGLTGRDNVILTPHAAFYSDASILDNRTISANNIRHFLNNEHDLVRKYVA